MLRPDTKLEGRVIKTQPVRVKVDPEGRVDDHQVLYVSTPTKANKIRQLYSDIVVPQVYSGRGDSGLGYVESGGAGEVYSVRIDKKPEPKGRIY